MSQQRIGMNAGARRAESFRRTANVELQKLDDVQTLGRAMSMRLKHNYSPDFKKGYIVYYWRNITSKSAAQRRVHGWRGPCILLEKVGLSRIYLGAWGSLILVSPEQLRQASLDEMMAMESMEEMARAMGDDLSTKQQMGYLDERGAGPTAAERASSSTKEEADRAGNAAPAADREGHASPVVHPLPQVTEPNLAQEQSIPESSDDEMKDEVTPPTTVNCKACAGQKRAHTCGKKRTITALLRDENANAGKRDVEDPVETEAKRKRQTRLVFFSERIDRPPPKQLGNIGSRQKAEK